MRVAGRGSARGRKEGSGRHLACKELKDDQTKRPHVKRTCSTHTVCLLREHCTRELWRAVRGRYAHGYRLARTPRVLEVDDLPFEPKEHKVMRLEVAVNDILRVEVLDDVREPIDDKLALVAL